MTIEHRDIPLDLTAIEAALGRMVYRAGRLEAAVRYAAGRLATTAEQLQALGSLPAGKLVNKAREYAKTAVTGERISNDDRAELVKLLDETNVHLKSRNTYIHGVWLTRADGSPFVMLNQKDFTVMTRPLAAEEIGKLSGTLLALSNDVFDWTVRVLGEDVESLA
ncbi:hypothetical protein OG762_51515 (plasmid) [Streptomyces sp. NBC_01136]|uniref:hypothetical protein n=1 Tax=Streptomyces sp. NBC_01136 TaxID=2903754 RepID=UPI002F912A1D|nr:hypothetical protein OG762_51515 [Streptomyces sp. NBC_01136]